MKTFPTLIFLLFLSIPLAGWCGNKIPAIDQKSSFLFTENKGQIADSKGNARPDVLFSAHSDNVQIFLTATGIFYQFTKLELPPELDRMLTKRSDFLEQEKLLKQTRCSTARFTLSLEGSNLHPEIIKSGKDNYTENFYLPGCPDGITNVSTFKKITYKNVYPGIDWVIYSADGHMKYDFIVHPGANPSSIKLKISDAENIGISDEGALVMKTRLGEIKDHAPATFCNGKKIASKYVLDQNRIKFAVDAYEKSEDLIIDPSVAWATYYGGTNLDWAASCTTNSAGEVYVSGSTYGSSNLATSGGFQISFGGMQDIFLAKFDVYGNRMWATYYGGSGFDNVSGLTLDAQGNFYITGSTSSFNVIATAGSYQSSMTSGANAFLVKFTPSGQRVWGTYYGGYYFNGSFLTGSSGDVGSCVAVDLSGNIYMGASATSNYGVVTPPAFQSIWGGTKDGLLVKFNASGSKIWSTYFGGSELEQINGIAIDANNNVFISGVTYSDSNIASPNAFQATRSGDCDAFLAKFDSAGSRIWSTYYGGSIIDDAGHCTVDSGNNVYLAGTTGSTSNIAFGGFQNTLAGTNDAFLVKFNAAGSRIWGTYFGGTNFDGGAGCTMNNTSIYLYGTTSSTSGITINTLQNTYGGGATDGYFARFDTSGNLIYSSYYGGSSDDNMTSLSIRDTSNFLVSGYTTSANGIAVNGFQNTYGGNYDVFLAKISNTILPTITTNTINPATYCAGSTINVPFTISNSSNSSNIFTAQLSDSSGSFSAPVIIGTLNASGNGTISATIPSNTPMGTSYRIRVIGSNPILVGFANTANITILQPPTLPSIITGDTVVCVGTSQVYSVNPVPGATSYTWTLPGGWSGSATTNAVTAITGITPGVIQVNATNNCGMSPTRTLTITSVNTTPTQPLIITGHENVCVNSIDTFYVAPVSGATSYTWTLPNGWTGSSATDSIIATAGNTGGSISVSANNACGNSAPQTLNVMVAVPPVIPGNINGSIIVCTGATATYDITSVANANSYAWTLPNGWSGSSATNSIVTTVADSGIITVAAINNCGSSLPKSLTIAAIDSPATPGPISGVNPICSGVTQTYFVATAPGAISYAWTIPNGWSGTSITDSIVVTAGTTGGIIAVTANNGICQSADSSVLQITVSPTPPAPVISLIGNLLVSDIANVQWYGPNGIIPGATSQTYTPTAYGNYYAVATNSSCNSASSNMVNVTQLSVHAYSIDEIKCYPNPTTGKVIIDWGNQVANGFISLYSVDGACLSREVLLATRRKEFDLSGYANGSYFLELRDKNGISKTLKLSLIK